MTDSAVELVVSGDDYLLELGREAAVRRVGDLVPDAEVVPQPDGMSAHDLAVELRSPSLFQPHRVLIAADAERWLEAPAPEGRAAPKREDPAPLVELLREGVTAGVALVLAGHVGRRPKGPLVDAVAAAGTVTWLPLPEPPKPWEEAVISDQQREVLRGVVERAAPSAELTDAGERLLFDRLGFAPRRLAQEVRKLAAAGDGVIDADVVRSLTAPQAASMDVVLDALELGDLTPVFDLLAAAAAGRSVIDWRGERLDGPRFYGAFVGTFGRHLEQMAYLRLLAERIGSADQLDVDRCAARGWYSQVFKSRLGPALIERIETDSPNPFVQAKSRKKRLSPWYLHRLFRAAARFPDDVLREALVELAEVERQARGPAAAEAVSRWVCALR